MSFLNPPAKPLELGEPSEGSGHLKKSLSWAAT